MRTYTGGCHCGRVRYEVTADLARVTECNCSICTQKAYLHLIVPRDRFRLLAGEAELASYRFGTMTARHLFCRHCGVASFYVPRSHPDRIDVNVRCLDGVDLVTLAPRPFDGRHWEASIGTLEVQVAAPRDPYEGLLEPVAARRDLRLRRMFGCWAYYADDRLVWVSAAGRAPWHGILVPTAREHHAELRRAVPGLRVHPVLGKWLYLPARHPEFEAVADVVAGLIADGDARIGVVPAPRRRLRPRKERFA